MARVYLKGLPQLRTKLVKLRSETIDKVRAAMEAAASEITGTMRRLVPVDQGDLRDSIGWTWGEAPKGSLSVSHTIGGNTIVIFAGNEKAFYARWVEFGTAPHAIKVKNAKALGKDGRLGTEVSHPGARKRPFFFPSYRANKKQVKAMIRKAITAAVRDAVK